MKKLALAIALLTSPLAAKDVKQVQVVATHAVSREDAGPRSQVDSVVVGAGRPRTMTESFNLDTVIDGQHVVLVCDDPKGCEAPSTGKTYEAELKRNRWFHLSFMLPVSNKQVTRWYKIAGSW